MSIGRLLNAVYAARVLMHMSGLLVTCCLLLHMLGQNVLLLLSRMSIALLKTLIASSLVNSSIGGTFSKHACIRSLCLVCFLLTEEIVLFAVC